MSDKVAVASVTWQGHDIATIALPSSTCFIFLTAQVTLLMALQSVLLRILEFLTIVLTVA